MQGINENKADIITQLQMQKERGGVVVVKKGVCVSVQHGSYKSRAIVSYDF